MQTHKLGVVAVLAYDDADVLPGIALIVRGELHVIEDLKTAARQSGVLFGDHRHKVHHGEYERDDGEHRVASALR